MANVSGLLIPKGGTAILTQRIGEKEKEEEKVLSAY